MILIRSDYFHRCRIVCEAPSGSSQEGLLTGGSRAELPDSHYVEFGLHKANTQNIVESGKWVAMYGQCLVISRKEATSVCDD